MSHTVDSPCRLCYECNTPQIDVCTVKIDGWNIPLVIHRLFDFKIRVSDQLPTVVCDECLQYVKEYYNFYVRVKQVQRDLQKNTQKNEDEKKRNKTSAKRASNKSACSTRTRSKRIIPLEDSQSITIKNEPLFYDHIDRVLPDIPIKDEFNYNIPINTVKTELNLDHLDGPNKDEDELSDINGNSDMYTPDQEYADTCDMGTADEADCEKKDSGGFPEHIYKDGKLTVTGSDLDALIRKFYNIQCDMCLSKPKFSTCFKLFEHCFRKHKTEGYVSCCDMQLKTRKKIIGHMISHVQPNAFQCKLCKRVYRTNTALISHMKRHLPDSEKAHPCDQCSKGFISAAALTAHKIVHVPLDKREIFECKECDKTFNVQRYYENHVRHVHTTKKYLCPVCGNNFKTKSNLECHMFIHDPEGKHRIECKDCGFVCKSRYTLSVHKKKHSAVRIQCTLCDYNTYLNNNLKMHMKIKHSDDKPYVCELCGKGFKMSILLKTHMPQHTGERKYTCTFCPRMFVSSGNCYAHRKRMHPEQHKDIVRAKQLDIRRNTKESTGIQEKLLETENY